VILARNDTSALPSTADDLAGCECFHQCGAIIRLRLLSLPDGDQAREVVVAVSEIGKRLQNAVAHRERTETTVLLEEPETQDAETIQEDEKSAKAEAERSRPEITMLTDGLQLDDGATGRLLLLSAFLF
jgi:hypothetical protein